MWNQDDLRLPKDWIVYQRVTITDGSTFDLYLKNMKSLLGAMMRNPELIICNHHDNIEDLESCRRTLKTMNNHCEIVFEDEEGEIGEVSEADLPYDMSTDVIGIASRDYGIWCVDTIDKPNRYRGKMMGFTAMVLKSPNFPKNYFVPGRVAVTCCETDMTFLGCICKAGEARKLKTKEQVRVHARIEYEEWPDYQGTGPVLYVETVEPAEPVNEIVQF